MEQGSEGYPTSSDASEVVHQQSDSGDGDREESQAEGTSRISTDEEEDSLNYCLEFGLLFPLKVSLFPVKSSPSVLVDSGTCEPVVVMMEGDCSVERRRESQTSNHHYFGHESDGCSGHVNQQDVELRRKSHRRSLMRRRSTSVPDLDKLVFVSKLDNHNNLVFQYPSSSTTSPHQHVQHHPPHCVIECDNANSPHGCEDEYNSDNPTISNNSWRSNGENLLATGHIHNSNHSHLYLNYPYLHPESRGHKGSNPVLISGAKSLPRIANLDGDASLRKNVNQHKSGSLADLPSFSMPPSNNTPSPSGGHLGSIGDWMNEINRYRREGQRQGPSSSEMLAAAVPLETVTTHKRKLTETSSYSGTATTSDGWNKNSIGPSSSPSPRESLCLSTKSIPKLNIYAVEGDVDVFEGSSSEDCETPGSTLRSGHSSIQRSLNRLFVIHDYNDSDGVITISGPTTPSRRSSRSRSGSFTGSDTSAISFRIPSRSESPEPPPVHHSHSCCGVSLRGSSPLPTSPPYQTSFPDVVTSRHCFSSSSSTSNKNSYVGDEGEIDSGSASARESCSSYGGRDSSPTRNKRQNELGSSNVVDNLHIVSDSSNDFPRIDPSFRLRKTGMVASGSGKRDIMVMPFVDGQDGVVQHSKIISREILDSMKKGKDGEVSCGSGSGAPSQKCNHYHQPLPGTTVVSFRKRSRAESRRGGTSSANISSSSCSKGHTEDTDKCTELQVIMPTIERAKRLSRLIQHRQHLQLQYSLNLNYLVCLIFHNKFILYILFVCFTALSFVIMKYIMEFFCFTKMIKIPFRNYYAPLEEKIAWTCRHYVSFYVLI